MGGGLRLNDETEFRGRSDLGWLGDIITTLGKTGMAVGAISALILDNTIPGTDEERGLTAWGNN